METVFVSLSRLYRLRGMNGRKQNALLQESLNILGMSNQFCSASKLSYLEEPETGLNSTNSKDDDELSRAI